MSFWDDALQELRRDFITGAVGRLSELEACIESLASDPRDASALAGIIGHFHRLAGAGASFGLPAVSRLGASGERSSLAVRDEGRGPTSEELAEWLQLLRDASAEFQRSSSPDTWVDGRADSSIASSAGRFQALVVDDDPDVVRLLRMILERHGGLVRSAASVAAAQDALSALLPDLLVVDVLLRDGSGHDLVERVRSLPRGAGVSILTCSSRGAGRERAEAVRRGADAFLQKPIDRGEVIARVDQLLSRPGLTPGRVAYLGEGGLARRSLESPLASL
ncbi:MAG: response regulator, partial [Acidobacteria bacterium]|nr:response regulator [Acidobacteriota bacterium]